jgi:hypothetical protein
MITNLDKCANCNKRVSAFTDTEPWWTLQRAPYETWYLCSLSCLTEYVWKLRESQPKLSKSKQE